MKAPKNSSKMLDLEITLEALKIYKFSTLDSLKKERVESIIKKIEAKLPERIKVISKKHEATKPEFTYHIMGSNN